MELQAITGQLYIIDGVVQEGGVPGLLAQPAPPRSARSRERDFLFVHLALTGRPAETAVLAQDLLDTVSRRFYQAYGSVTAALRQAIVEVNDLLLRQNLSGAGAMREGAITCAVLRRGELFMLQTGEALALLGHNFGVERLPPQPPARVTPLGRSAGIDIRFFHRLLQPGDMLLLADPRIAHLPPQALNPALVDTEVELGLEELKHAVGTDTARLLLIEFSEDTPADLPDVVRTVDSGGSATDRSLLAGSQLATEPASREPLLSQQRMPRREAQGVAAQPSRSANDTRARTAVDVELTARRATSQAAIGLSRFTGWLAELLSRLRPPRPRPDEHTGWALPMTLAIIIPVIVALIVSSVYLQRGRVRRFAEIRVEIGHTLGLAEGAAGDPASARGYYDAVLALAAEAETLRPGDEEITRLRRQALTQLDRLDGVTRLRAQPYYQYRDPTELAAIILRDGFNGGFYTLDHSGAVYEHETDESYLSLTASEPQLILFSGQAVGNHVAGRVIDIMWRPKGVAVSRDGLAMLDSNSALLTYYPNFTDIRAVPLGLASEWRLPYAITSFGERLYILDPGARQIWKYFPDGDAFQVRENDRTIAFTENPGLEQAIDFDIYSEDGSLLVLYGDGRIRYYDTRSGRVQWDETQLMQTGLNTPFVAPTSARLVGRGLNASIFVADPGSNRIVQISRGGTVLAQYRTSDASGQELFSRISDFAVAEAPLRVFVTAGNTIYMAVQE